MPGRIQRVAKRGRRRREANHLEYCLRQKVTESKTSKWSRISDPQLAPDGRNMAFTVQTIDPGPNPGLASLKQLEHITLSGPHKRWIAEILND